MLNSLTNAKIPDASGDGAAALKKRAVILLVAGSLWSGGLPSVAVSTDNPFAVIINRNAFGLVPIPVHNPGDAPPAPLPKIMPNGIMTIFGRGQVLFKVVDAEHRGTFNGDKSYVLGEGEQQDDIQVQKIDELSATITFNNHGTIQQLSLVAASSSSAVATANGTAGSLIASDARAANDSHHYGPVPSFGNTPATSSDSASTDASTEANESQADQIALRDAQRYGRLTTGNPATGAINPGTDAASPASSETQDSGGVASSGAAALPGIAGASTGQASLGNSQAERIAMLDARRYGWSYPMTDILP